MKGVTGLHHITAICGEPRRNKKFYTELLGLNFVKKTVNHDDPTTYHLYYGDEDASPGTLLTFFPWTHLPRATRGVQETQRINFEIPLDTMSFWENRLKKAGMETRRETVFGTTFLYFEDSHGLRLGLAENRASSRFAESTTVEAPSRIQGFHSVHLCVAKKEPTTEVLEVLGYQERRNQDEWTEMRIDTDSANAVYLEEDPSQQVARQGIGSVHHVAYGTPTRDKELELREAIKQHGLQITNVVDRKYFKSLYFHEPNNVLFEIATHGPGFNVDEDKDRLGEKLVLPEHLEQYRDEIENQLPEL